MAYNYKSDLVHFAGYTALETSEMTQSEAEAIWKHNFENGNNK